MNDSTRKLPFGSVLDKLVHVRVFGLPDGDPNIPPYTRDLFASMSLIEFLRGKGLQFFASSGEPGSHPWKVEFHEAQGKRVGRGLGTTLAHAVAMAALDTAQRRSKNP